MNGMQQHDMWFRPMRKWWWWFYDVRTEIIRHSNEENRNRWIDDSPVKCYYHYTFYTDDVCLASIWKFQTVLFTIWLNVIETFVISIKISAKMKYEWLNRIEWKMDAQCTMHQSKIMMDETHEDRKWWKLANYHLYLTLLSIDDDTMIKCDFL